MSDKPIFAFVLMPFHSKYDDVYTIGIKEAAEKVGIVAERLDKQIFAEGMMERVYRQIEAADIIIAELSEKNPNVFYEVGYAHAKDKLCILQTNDAQDIPFDLRHRRHIVYNGSLTYLRDELIKNLEWAKTEIENIRKSQIRVELKPPSGDLITEGFLVKAFIHFRFDLFNDSNKSSSEITAIYFYSGHFWDIKQGNVTCSYTDSDISKYRRRYFLTPPVTRLQRQSWAQLQFNGTRTIAVKTKGDEVKDEYTLRGVATLRFVTTDGTYDYEFHLDINVNDLPF
jgi:hypothetical protein